MMNLSDKFLEKIYEKGPILIQILSTFSPDKLQRRDDCEIDFNELYRISYHQGRSFAKVPLIGKGMQKESLDKRR